MRLDSFTRRVIVETIEALDSQAEVWLYGSRTDDSKKGGDIDLLVFSEKLSSNDRLLSIKTDILFEIQRRIGEQRIDLTIASAIKKSQDDWIASILPTAIRIDT